MPKFPHNVALSFSDKSLTHFGGLYLVQQFFRAIRLRSRIARGIPLPLRNTRYSVSDSVVALLYPILLGLGRLETAKLLQQNGVFQYLTGLPTYPNPTTLRRFLTRLGEHGLDGLIRVHDALRQDFLGQPSSMILDIDSTVLTVYGNQAGAAVGFNPKKRGRRSYHPVLCFDGKSRDVFSGRYRSGDTHPASVTHSMLDEAFAKLPSEVKQVRLRADGAFYNHRILQAIEEKRAFYVIPAQMTRPLKNRVGGLRYRSVSTGVSAADFSYQPARWKQERRHVVIRRPIPEEPSYQLTLFQMGRYNYQVLVTNLDLTPLHLWRFYNRRANAELIIRELKEAYALGKIPTRDWSANQAFFQLTLLGYNLLNWFKRFCLPREWHRLSLQTIRHRLLLIPAELVRPQGRPTLKFPIGYPHKQVYLQTLKNIRRMPW